MMVKAATHCRAGCFGKVRSRGDFVTRHLPPDFVEPWDAMIQAGMIASRAALGDAWLSTWLSAPLWNFVIDAGLLGPVAWRGVLMPSVDRVGRYFPLTIAAPFAGAGHHADVRDPQTWFTRCAEIALDTLDDDVDFGQTESALRSLPVRAESRPTVSMVDEEGRRTSVWWVDGSEANSVFGGLPDPAQFAALISR